MFTFFGKIFTSIAIGVSSLFGLHTSVPEAAPSVSTSTQAATIVSEPGTKPPSHSTTETIAPRNVVSTPAPVSSSMQNTPVHVTTPVAPPQSANQTQKVEPVSRVQETPIVQAPKIRVTANPATVEYGGTSVISWVATDALSCTLGSSPVLLAVTGSQSVSPTDSSKDWTKSDKKTYSITCTSAGSSVSENVTVTVQPWKPSAECQKAFDGYYYRNEITLNPTFCSKMEM